MALKKEAVAKLKALGFDVDKLIAAIQDEAEKDYEIPKAVLLKDGDIVLTSDQAAARDANMKEEGKKEAEPAIRATLVKELGKKLNLELKSDRIGDVVKEIETFASKNNDEKVGLLQQQVQALTADKIALTQSLEQEKARASQAAFDAELISYFPDNRGEDLTDSDRLSIIKSNLQFETVDGKIVVKKAGQIQLDDATKAPKAPKDVLTDFFKEKPSLLGTVKVPPVGGRGAGDHFGGGGGSAGVKTMSAAQEQWLKDNPGGNTTSPEFTAYVGKLAEENTDFKWYE